MTLKITPHFSWLKCTTRAWHVRIIVAPATPGTVSYASLGAVFLFLCKWLRAKSTCCKLQSYELSSVTISVTLFVEQGNLRKEKNYVQLKQRASYAVFSLWSGFDPRLGQVFLHTSFLRECALVDFVQPCPVTFPFLHFCLPART